MCLLLLWLRTGSDAGTNCHRLGGRIQGKEGELTQLRAAPGCFEAPDQLVAEALDRDSDLLEGVAVAEGDGLVVHRLVVDGDAPGGADLVLAAVALADRAALVELGGEAAAQILEDLAGLLRHPLLGDEREDGDLDRRKARVQAQDGALAALDLLDLV